MSLLAFRNALVTVYNADNAVKAITGRATLNLVPRGAQAYEENLPVMTYFIVTSPNYNGTQGHRRVTVQFEAWADEEKDANVFGTLETLMDRAEALFIGPVLKAQSVDCARPRITSREDAGPEDGVRSLRADFTFDLTV
jgi:hypothetical protein